jgi:site-specific DNA-methyltransferase (adenine-specific)
MNPALFSSQRQDWETPQALFDELNAEFGFTVDVCATPRNAKCAFFFSPEQDGLAQDWERRVCWMNPPYGRQISAWIDKALRQRAKGATIVCLVPSRTDTRWFQKCIDAGCEIRFLPGRLKFAGAQHPAPFPSAVIVMRPPRG